MVSLAMQTLISNLIRGREKINLPRRQKMSTRDRLILALLLVLVVFSVAAPITVHAAPALDDDNPPQPHREMNPLAKAFLLICCLVLLLLLIASFA
jgi:hypothetical protein